MNLQGEANGRIRRGLTLIWHLISWAIWGSEVVAIFSKEGARFLRVGGSQLSCSKGAAMEMAG